MGTLAGVEDPWAHQEGLDSCQDTGIHEVSLTCQGLGHACTFSAA